MDERSEIVLQNKICRKLDPANNYCKAVLHLKYHGKVGVKHLLDVTRDIIIGENTMLAGSGSQIWTHKFYFRKDGDGFVRVDSGVEVGHNCYIGSRCIILSGVKIGDCITVGANACVSKSILARGLYVSQPLRMIPFDPDETIDKMGDPISTSTEDGIIFEE